MSNGSPEFSLIIPTLNEAQNITLLLERLEKVLKPIPHEMIVVDDESEDGTASRVQAYQRNHATVQLIKRSGRRGLSSAVMEGFGVAQGELLGVMDADLSHDETILPLLITAVRQGADLAVGSRRIPGGGADHWPWYRRLTSSLATGLARTLLNISLSDPMSGFFVLRRSFYEGCRSELAPQGYKILVEIYCKGRPEKISEIPFIFKDRRQGHSKLSSRVMFEYLKSLWSLQRDSRRKKRNKNS